MPDETPNFVTPYKITEFDKELTIKFLESMEESFKSYAHQVEISKLPEHELLSHLLKALLEMAAVLDNNIYVFAALYKRSLKEKTSEN